MKIIAIGWNYADHNKELNQTRPEKPTIFLKPETALLKSNKPFYLPDFSDRVEYEAEIIVRVCKLGKNIESRFAPRYYDAVGLGIDITARDMQAEFRNNGSPWDLCKGFDNSAPISEFYPLSDFGGDIQNIHFHLDINGKRMQEGHTADMLFKVDEIIEYTSQFYTYKMGDILFTGTPSGVGKLNIGDHVQGYIEDRLVLDFEVK